MCHALADRWPPSLPLLSRPLSAAEITDRCPPLSNRCPTPLSGPLSAASIADRCLPSLSQLLSTAAVTDRCLPLLWQTAVCRHYRADQPPCEYKFCLMCHAAFADRWPPSFADHWTLLLSRTASRRHSCKPLYAAALTDRLPVGPPTTGHRRTSRLPDLCTVNSVFRIRIRNFVIPGNITGVTNALETVTTIFREVCNAVSKRQYIRLTILTYNFSSKIVITNMLFQLRMI